jgi:hypothetical protein
MTALRVTNKRARAKRGTGRGSEYKPSLVIQDVPSRGLATRIQGWKTHREHHFFSKLELLFFYLLEWSLTVCDIREQYPLDLSETLAIAQQLGIRHPTNPRTGRPIVMTTDFLITIRKPTGLREYARTIKYAKDLSSIRVMEKFEIERLYWGKRNIDWGIVTENEINVTVATNIQWVHPYKEVTSLTPITGQVVSVVEAVLTFEVLKQKTPLRDLTNRCDEKLGLAPGSSLTVVRHLIATRKWRVDMNRPIRAPKPLILTAIPKMVIRRKAGQG